MYYITNIFDEATKTFTKRLESGTQTRTWSVSKWGISCNQSDLNTVKVAIYDTTDKSTEWWFVNDLLKVVVQQGIQIEGLKLYKRRRLTCNEIPYCFSSIVLHVALSSSDDAYINKLAKMKLTGYEISPSGVLSSMNASSIKNGVLTFPDICSLLSDFTLVDYNVLNPVKVIVVNNIEIFTYGFKYFIKKYNLVDIELIINSDIFIGSKVFEVLANSSPRIKVNGVVTLGSLAHTLEKLNIRAFKGYDKVKYNNLVISDNNNTWYIDVDNRLIKKQKNK